MGRDASEASALLFLAFEPPKELHKRWGDRLFDHRLVRILELPTEMGVDTVLRSYAQRVAAGWLCRRRWRRLCAVLAFGCHGNIMTFMLALRSSAQI